MTDIEYKDRVPHRVANPKNVVTTAVGYVQDSMASLISGLGGAFDKNTSNRHVFREMTDVELENAYRGDWIARKIVDLVAQDMTREGRNWQTKKDNIEKIETEEARLGLWSHLLTAQTLGRLYGGGALIVGGPGHPEDPLLPEDVRRGGLRYLLPVSRYDLRAVGLDVDMESPWFGQPMLWELQLQNQGLRSRIRYPRLHPSRVIRFFGNPIPQTRLGKGANDHWSDSVLQVVNDAVMHASVAQAGIAGLVQEAKIDVVRIPGLMEHLSTAEYSERLVQRFQYAAAAKSNNNTLILDAEELWERKQINFTQLPDVLKLYLQIASGAASIPATLLAGLSPQGLNASGDTEERVYYDRVKSQQKADLTPKIAPLDLMIQRSAMGKSPRSIFYMWSPLWQMSDKEKAAISKTKAETVRAIADTNLIPMKVLGRAQANQLIEDAMFPGFEEAFEENGEAIGPGPVKKADKPDPTKDPADPAKPAAPGAPVAGGTEDA